MAMARPQNKWAEGVGHVFAHVQDGIDFFTEMGFRALKSAGKQPPSCKKDENQYLCAAKKTGFSVLSFLGEAGDAFYARYEQLKAERMRKKQD